MQLPMERVLSAVYENNEIKLSLYRESTGFLYYERNMYTKKK